MSWRDGTTTLVHGAMIALLLFAAAAATVEAEEPTLRFSWALVHQDAHRVDGMIDYNRSILDLRSGDRFRFVLRPDGPCVFYLLLYDSQHRLFLLYPDDLDDLDKSQREQTTQRQFSVPGPGSWYYLDESRGVETVYLVASWEHIESLDENLRRYMRLEGRSGGPEAISAKHAVLDEIKRLVNENSLLSGNAEKPVAVAGDFRGITGETQTNGLSVVTSRIYVKTIRLRH